MEQVVETERNEDWKKIVFGMTLLFFFGFFAVIYIKTYLAYSDMNVSRSRLFGATYMTMNNDFYKVMNNEIQYQVDQMGDHLITLDPALDAEKQNEQISYLVKKKVDLIFLNPVDLEKIKVGLQVAKDAHIPVIVLDTAVYENDLTDVTIVSDNYEAGVVCAKDMIKRKKQANILLLTHESTKSGAERIQGFLDTIKGNDKYQIVNSVDTQGQIERALPKVEEILKQKTKIDVIMALNDPSAMGALAALERQSYEKDVLVYGVDASPEAKKLIKEGRMTGTAAQFPKKIAKTGIEAAYDILAGKQVKKTQVIPIRLITKENIKDWDVNRW